MSSFLTNLGKGFIRSAVNQVGRDSGRVISNRVFKDKHSTPIRNVSYSGGIYVNDLTNEEISEEQMRKTIVENGYKPKFCHTNMLLKAWMILCGWIASALLFNFWGWWGITPGVCLFLMASEKLIAKNIDYIGNKKEIIYKKDQRTITGTRACGYTLSKEGFSLLATKQQRIKMRVIGCIYIVIAIAITYFGYQTCYTLNSSSNTDSEIIRVENQ